MSSHTGRTPRSEAFRLAIAAFIDERREAKQKGQELDADAASKYDYSTWLADAARRVSQIQAVTHVLKATHPDARGSSLYVSPGELAPHEDIGSHVLADGFAVDVVGNAAALDVFKFLKLDVEGRRLLDWVQAQDADLAGALHDDPAIAASWLAAWGGLVRQGGQPASHELAKQVYWLAGDDAAQDDQYHLLQPQFPSSLVHAVHDDIREARFGEANTALRRARRDRQPATGVNHEYVGLAVRKLGGTKPQNISQLNSDRGGANYLLASLPPQPVRVEGPRLLHRSSAVDLFGQQPEVRLLLRELADFLKTDPPAVMATRTRREGIEQALGAQLLVFGETVHASQPPGWTRSADCQLPECEKLWLDPGRADPDRRGDEHPDEDAAFERAYHWGDWPDEVASRFARWINARLREHGVLGLGDTEYHHWARQAVIETVWPIPLQRRAVKGGL
ncbi:type I-F CRISPR-associated protein Csy1 [Amphibiibacter pelophylacis]|uniref:Type I-F CRISPR-associated protein Csy1 n=1 Tax=Amphibiibacter pelophylacis TaxID=1799477 RepID=A0ACC6P2C4_9BURK